MSTGCTAQPARRRARGTMRGVFLVGSLLSRQEAVFERALRWGPRLFSWRSPRASQAVGAPGHDLVGLWAVRRQDDGSAHRPRQGEIGRASCRERVESSVGDGLLYNREERTRRYEDNKA